MDKELQAISVRKARLVDGGKVRYRVYSTPSEFVMVAAESALMAFKLSGIASPHKIVRDLGVDAGAIDAQRMAPPEEVPEKVDFTTAYTPQEALKLPELPTPADAQQAPFVPMHLADLQQQGQRASQILSPEIAHEIVEEVPVPVAEVPKPSAAPAQQAPAAAPVVADGAPLAPEPVVSQEQKLAQLADDLLPAAQEKPADAELSPEEVEKLLNG